MSKPQPLKIVYKPITDLIPDKHNARLHSESQVKTISKSIKEFNFTNPILIDANNNIIAGHGRLAAATKIGMTDVPTIELAYLTKAQQKAYMIADNKLSLDATWDDDLLRLTFDDLKAENYDTKLTGFTDDELSKLYSPLNFEPVSSDEQGKLDEKAKIICPECHHAFNP